MTNITKYIAIAKITDPIAVQTKCATEGGIAHKGAIYCEIPELGITMPNLVYCRYGLSIPYIRVQADWKLLVEPTVENERRWFYTGLADCADAVTPATTDQLLIQLLSQVIYASNDTLFLSSKTATEPFVLGNKLKTYIDNYIQSVYNAHTHTYIPPQASYALPSTVTGTPSVTGAIPTDIYSIKIKGE